MSDITYDIDDDPDEENMIYFSLETGEASGPLISRIANDRDIAKDYIAANRGNEAIHEAIQARLLQNEENSRRLRKYLKLDKDA